MEGSQADTSLDAFRRGFKQLHPKQALLMYFSVCPFWSQTCLMCTYAYATYSDIGCISMYFCCLLMAFIDSLLAFFRLLASLKCQQVLTPKNDCHITLDQFQHMDLCDGPSLDSTQCTALSYHSLSLKTIIDRSY